MVFFFVFVVFFVAFVLPQGRRRVQRRVHVVRRITTGDAPATFAVTLTRDDSSSHDEHDDHERAIRT
ncbi:MAG TPA: hypothetical protein VGD94_19310, partial [Vicinamibacterales bacterium]